MTTGAQLTTGAQGREAHRDVVAVGASAGGVEALRALVAGLPPDFAAVLLIVLHLPRDAPSALAGILGRSGPLPAGTARDGEALGRGRVLVAASDHHLLLIDGHLRLSRGPAENGHRPAIDPLFRSVARAVGPRAVGVVLSGARDDGADGLAVIAERGGATVVQDPSDALYPSMPRAALERVTPDHVAPAAALGGLLAAITRVALPRPCPPERDPRLDAEVATAALEPVTADELSVAPAGYGCPSCGGAMFEIGTSAAPRYRCRIGHAWTAQSLLDEQAVALEGALFMALRALEEKSSLSRRMAAARPVGHTALVARLRRSAADADAAGATIRQLIARLGAPTVDPARHADHPDGPPEPVR